MYTKNDDRVRAVCECQLHCVREASARFLFEELYMLGSNEYDLACATIVRELMLHFFLQ
jgi:hypothetical protein